jgi:hypothetical protein
MGKRARMRAAEQVAAAAADYAGSMKVSPGFRAGRKPVAPSSPIENTLVMGKQVMQGPTTGFGSFRSPPLRMDAFVDIPQ